MQNEKPLIITNLFFFTDQTILVIKGLDKKKLLNASEFSMFMNDHFIKNINLISEYFIERKSAHLDERAFVCKQKLEEFKEIDCSGNVLSLRAVNI